MVRKWMGFVVDVTKRVVSVMEWVCHIGILEFMKGKERNGEKREGEERGGNGRKGEERK